MEHFVESQNIENYKHLLRLETDPVKRATLLRLLVEEEAKRAARVEHQK